MTIPRVSLLALLATTLPAAAADGVDAGALRPGLVASYRDAARPATNEVVRLEPTIALALKAGEAPHPRLAADVRANTRAALAAWQDMGADV